MEAQFQRILSRCNLEQDYKEAFLPTTPLWYGLWAQSPLSPPALRVVRTLLSDTSGRMVGHGVCRTGRAQGLQALDSANLRKLPRYDEAI